MAGKSNARFTGIFFTAVKIVALAIDICQANEPPSAISAVGTNGLLDLRHQNLPNFTNNAAYKPNFLFVGSATISAASSDYIGIFQLIADKNRDENTVAAAERKRAELTLRRLVDGRWSTVASSGVQAVHESASTQLRIQLNEQARAILISTGKSRLHNFDDDESDNLRLYLSAELPNENSFVRYARVKYDIRISAVFIQTDKGIYKPGETVRFRVFAVDLEHLKPINETIEISVEDPARNLNQKWTIVGGDQMPGYVSRQLELSEEPVFGEWKITAQIKGTEKQVKFTVDKYVLPKFEVVLKLPESVSIDDASTKVNVDAKYTYGKPVKGKLYVTSDCTNNAQTIEPNFSGNATVTLHNLFENKRDISFLNPTCRIDVSLEEALTGNRQNASGTVTAYTKSFKVRISEAFGVFQPGLPYILDIKLSHIDGKPVASRFSDEKLKITTRIDDESKNVRDIGMKELADDTYRATFLTPKSSTALHVEVQFKEQTENDDKRASTMKSQMYIQIQPERKDIGASEGKAQAQLQWTQPVNKLSYLVLAHGNVVIEAGEYDTSAAHENAHGYYAQNITLQAFPPTTKLVVFAPHCNGSDTATTAITFNVDGQIRNNVSVSVAPNSRSEYARPGESATIIVNAEPHSLLGLLAVDKSVRLLKDFNDFTNSDLTKAVTDVTDYWQYYRRRSYLLDSKTSFETSSEPISTDMVAKVIDESAKSCSMFFSSRLLVISDICESPKIPTHHYRNFLLRGGAGRFGAGFAFRPNAAALSDDASSVGRGHSESSAAASDYLAGLSFDALSTPPAPPRVRQEFPETWIWLDEFANSSTTTFNKTVPDSVTTWLVNAVALHPERGLAVSNGFAELRVFQPFFVSMQLPYSVVRHELVYLQVSVFNYNDEPQEVEVKLEFEDASAFEFDVALHRSAGSIEQPNLKRMKIEAQGGATVTFPIRPLLLGDQPLTATARVISGQSQLADVEKRKLQVIPEGKPVYYNVPLFIDLRNQSELVGGKKKLPPVPILFPRESDNFVPDSEHVQVSVTGDLMAPTIRGLSNLVRLPYGCGEQNMINFVPNIMVLQYLTAVHRLTDELRDTSMEYVRKGYQRELQYRHGDGSYSAFGQSDHSGSTWLTAFVLKSFAQAEQNLYVKLDREQTQQSLQWLMKQQDSSGKFIENGTVIHSVLQGGGVGKVSKLNIPLTAYSIIALAQNQVDRESLNRSVMYLVSQLPFYSNDSYTLAIVNYALQTAGADATAARQALVALERLQKQDSQGRVYWSDKQATESFSMDDQAKLGYYYKPAPKEVETAAYVLLTYAAQKNIEKGLPVTRWLIAQRNDQGGFTSTQDTVVALEALSKFAALIFEGQLRLIKKTDNQAIEVTVSSAQDGKLTSKKFSVSNDNAVLLQVADLKIDAVTQELRLSARGTGTAIVNVAYRYNVKDDKGVPVFRLLVDTKEPSALNAKINICVEYLKPNLPSMVLVEAELPSGYEADPDDATQILSRYKGIVSRIDVEQHNTRVVVYFDQLKRTGNCVDFNAYRKFAVDDLKPKTITVYDYYDPRDRLTKSYELGKTHNICDSWTDNTLPCSKKLL